MSRISLVRVASIASTSWRPVPGHSDLHLIEAERDVPIRREGLRLPGLIRFLALSVQRDAGGDWLVEIPATAPTRFVVVAT